MGCPNCNNGKVTVVDTVKNDERNEIYRIRKCNGCGYRYFTTETVTEETVSFKNTFNRLRGKRDKRRNYI